MELILKRKNIYCLSVQATGRLDLDSAVEYGTKIKDYLFNSDEPITEVELDFGQISFISSFGLKVILELYKELKASGGNIKLINVSEKIMDVFKMVGFDKFLVFE